MYVKGMTTSDIETHIRDIYGIHSDRHRNGWLKGGAWDVDGENESAKFWISLLNGLKNRGVRIY